MRFQGLAESKPYFFSTSLVREVAVVLELCESYECGWVATKIATKILRFFRNDMSLVGFTPSHYEERERRSNPS